MASQPHEYAVEVKITHRRELEDALDRAVETAIQEGLKDRSRGVLVTRHDHRTFTVELSPAVLPGTIIEADLCSSV